MLVYYIVDLAYQLQLAILCTLLKYTVEHRLLPWSIQGFAGCKIQMQSSLVANLPKPKVGKKSGICGSHFHIRSIYSQRPLEGQQ